jgi:predicted flap endonuclease-1-like 5' DNA nuclease
MTNIVDIEGIGPAYAAKLTAIGLKTVEAYLEAAKDPKGRKEIAEKTGISDKLVLAWANKADLFRIKGVGSQLSDLLEAAGVDTVKELKHRNAANLHAKMVEVNAAKNLVNHIPGENQVAAWIEEAKTLPAMLTY